MLTLAAHWSQAHDVCLFWDSPRIISQAGQVFNLDLSRVRIVHNIFKGRSLLSKLWHSAAYDLIFFLTDGSVPTSSAKYNILHFQVPFHAVPVLPWKMSKINAVVCNSQFTKNHLDKRFGRMSKVIYPPVAVSDFAASKKKKIILSVGRFSSLYQAKKHSVLAQVFAEAKKNKLFTGWKLMLAGGVLPSDQEYFEKLVRNYNHPDISYYANASHSDLQKMYAEASIYWHAAGYGEENPEQMEHFGISTVEAMSAKCIPVVFAGGGQIEIVSDLRDGFLWQTPEDLIQKTQRVAGMTGSDLHRMRKAAQDRAADFSLSRFTRSYDQLLKEIVHE